MAAVTTNYDFDNVADWDYDEQEGPANKAPANLRALLVVALRAEWLDLSSPETMQYSKNHMVFSAILKDTITIDGKTYFSGRLSVEVDFDVGPEVKINGVNDILVCGEDYAPGTYTLSMRTYATPTNSAPHYRTYKLKEGTTIGQLIDEILTRKMDRFLFYVYTEEKNRFKGCGHHLLRVFTVYVDEKIVISGDSEEGREESLPGEPVKSLADELVYTYVRDNGIKRAYTRVGRGRFLEWDDAEHRLFDDQMWSAGPPLHQEKLANAGQA